MFLSNVHIIAFIAVLAIIFQYAVIFKAGISQKNDVCTPTANQTHKAADIIFQSCIDSGKGGKIPGSSRDCEASQGNECTYNQPCTPCGASWETEPCVSCSDIHLDNCFFIENVGPYCKYDDEDGVSVRACEKCCS